MTLYAYCIRRAGDAPPGPVAGIGGAPVSLLEHAGLGVWLSPGEAPPPTAEPLREHDRVVRAALASATPLPLRFGSVFADEAAVRAALETREAEFLAALERVAGRVEMAVTLFWDAGQEESALLQNRPELRPAEGEPASGREYLQRRRGAVLAATAMRERAGTLLHNVESSLTPGADVPTVRLVLPRPEVAGTISQLIPRDAVAAYRHRIEEIRATLPEARIALSGPWGPYSFV